MRFIVPALAALATLSATHAAIAGGDPAAGQKVFMKCRACHQVGETAKNGVGPVLNGLFGRKAGSIETFKYSDAYKSLDKVWDETNFAVYIKDPKNVTPGTKMNFQGLKSDEEIANITAFLRQYGLDGKML
jgi:cytochrome c